MPLQRVLVAFATFLAALFTTMAASALPRFAEREGLPCIVCHVNPSGGGMRTRYSHYMYGATRLPMFTPSNEFPLDVDIGDTLAFGADSRTAYLDLRPGPHASGSETSTFFQMQADFYVAAQIYKGLQLYYNQGAWGSFEAMGIWQQDFGRPDFSYYVKVGRFMPTYGIRLENHNVYTREDIGFGPRDKDQGVELGVYLGPVLVQTSVLNGNPGDPQLDDNNDKALTARVELRKRFGKLHVSAGGSIYKNQTGAVTNTGGVEVDGRTKILRWGPNWGAALGRFAYLGEADVVKNDPFPGNTQGQRVYTFQSYQEFDVLLVKGLELNINYEFRDPNLDLRNGTYGRVAGGIEFYPLPYVELKTLVRRTHAYRTGPATTGVDGLTEIIAMVHLYF
jgi:hypothetical protein